MDTLGKFKELTSLVENLVSQKRGLEAVVGSLRDENQRLKTENEGFRAQFKGFQNQGKIDNIVEKMDEDEGKRDELKSLINKYIQEIDQCIELLNIK